MLKKEWKEQGFIDEPVAEGVDLKAEIRRMCKEKDAIILAHYYTIGDIQDWHWPVRLQRRMQRLW